MAIKWQPGSSIYGTNQGPLAACTSPLSPSRLYSRRLAVPGFSLLVTTLPSVAPATKRRRHIAGRCLRVGAQVGGGHTCGRAGGRRARQCTVKREQAGTGRKTGTHPAMHAAATGQAAARCSAAPGTCHVGHGHAGAAGVGVGRVANCLAAGGAAAGGEDVHPGGKQVDAGAGVGPLVRVLGVACGGGGRGAARGGVARRSG